MIVFIGTNGTGKTTKLKELVSNLLKIKRRILIVTPDDVEWNSIPFVNDRFKERISSYKGARRMIFESDTIQLIDQEFRNGVLIFDDCRAYLDAHTSKELHTIMVRRRQRDIDVIFVAHGFSDVPPKFFNFATFYILFKTNENIATRKNRINNYPILAAAQEKVNFEAESNNPYYYEIIPA
jgi:ABC-type Na+ transport system ATPase subunit NatA